MNSEDVSHEKSKVELHERVVHIFTVNGITEGFYITLRETVLLRVNYSP